MSLTIEELTVMNERQSIRIAELLAETNDQRIAIDQHLRDIFTAGQHTGEAIRDLEALKLRFVGLEKDCDGMQHTIEELTANLALSRQHHNADIDLIGRTMMDAADRYSMCEQYDAVVEQLIGDPAGHKLHRLPERVRNCRFTTRVTIDIDCFAEHTRAGFDQADADDEYKFSVDQVREMLSIVNSEDMERKLDVLNIVGTYNSYDV